MELELSQALIEVRRLTLFAGPALGDAIPRYFTEEQLRELMAQLEDAQLCGTFAKRTPLPLQGPRARRAEPGSLGAPARTEGATGHLLEGLHRGGGGRYECSYAALAN